jgi:hypothetical protein
MPRRGHNPADDFALISPSFAASARFLAGTEIAWEFSDFTSAAVPPRTGLISVSFRWKGDQEPY